MINNLDANQCLKACFTFPTDQDEEKVTDVWSKGFSAQEKEIFNLFERMFQPLVPLDDRMEGWENTIAGEMLDEDLLKEGSEEWLKRAQEDMYAIKKIVDEVS